VGGELWLVGGWDPSAAPDQPQFLSDVWALDLRSYRWRRVHVAGEEMPHISRLGRRVRACERVSECGVRQ
jgi:hypothetical protein